jgi:hypothetical protein
MPVEAVPAQCEDTGHDVAARLGVSDEAIAWRLYNIGLSGAKLGAGVRP